MTEGQSVLELICGPSGVGKTATIRRRNRSFRTRTPEGEPFEVIPQSLSFRVTTRPIREGEVDTRNHDPGERPITHGYFVSEEEFLALAGEGTLVGVHRYPDPETGSLYGFHVRDMVNHFRSSGTVVVAEQIAAYAPVAEIAACFEGHGIPVKRELVLGPTVELEKRRGRRGDEEDKTRNERNKEETTLFLEHLGEFDEVRFLFPHIIYGEAADRLVEHNLALLKEGTMPDELFDDVNSWFQIMWDLAGEEQRLDIATRWHERRRGTGWAVVRNHFPQRPEIGSTWSRLYFLKARDGELGTKYLLDLGLAQLLEDHGLDTEAEERRIKVSQAVEAIANMSKQGFTPDLREKARPIQDLLLPALATRNRYNEKETQIGTHHPALREKRTEDMRVHSELYERIRELQNYLRVREWAAKARRGEDELGAVDFYNCVLFHLFLEKGITKIRDEFCIMVDQMTPLKREGMSLEERTGYWEGTVKTRLEAGMYEDEWEVLKRIGEGMILSSLAVQVATYRNIAVNYGIKALAAKYYGSLKEVTKQLVGEVMGTILLVKDDVPDHMLVRLGVLEAAIFQEQILIQCRDMERFTLGHSLLYTCFPGGERTYDHIERWWRPEEKSVAEELKGMALQSISFERTMGYRTD